MVAAPAFSDDESVTAGDDDFNLWIEHTDLGGGSPVASDGSADPIRDSDLDAICVSIALSVGEEPFGFCDLPPGSELAVLTPDVVAAAFARVPLPPSELLVQPPNGRTLVNFDTNFYTDTAAFDRTLTLLGQQVDLHIVPSAFGWRFGDGATMATEAPGSPYPKLDITHSYLRKGTVRPSVDTTYTATYRVNGGPWQEVPGSVTIAGVPVALDVVTASPVLVGH